MDNRTPKNMQELLRFAIKQQQNEGPECVPIDEDKKVFLNQVLQSMSVNVIEEFLKAIKILENEHSSDEEMSDALDIIKDYIDDIDFANSFAKLDGAIILINCVRNRNKTVCINAISIVAEMSQNNPFCQQCFLTCDAITHLIKYLSNEDSEVVANALYALSALIRNYEPALMEFIKNDGPRCINNCFSIESSRVFLKACFLVTSISSEFSLVRDEFAKLGLFNKLLQKLRVIEGYDVEIEMILNAISILLDSRHCWPNADENKYIINILNGIVIKNEDMPECEEIVACSKSILHELESRDKANAKY